MLNRWEPEPAGPENHIFDINSVKGRALFDVGRVCLFGQHGVESVERELVDVDVATNNSSSSVWSLLNDVDCVLDRIGKVVSMGPVAEYVLDVEVLLRPSESKQKFDTTATWPNAPDEGCNRGSDDNRHSTARNVNRIISIDIMGLQGEFLA